MAESGGSSRPRSIAAGEIFDARALRTLEVDLERGRISRAPGPSGVSRRSELRDCGDRLHGKGVQPAVCAVGEGQA
jgi:enolase